MGNTNPETCPNCGAEIPRKAKACPECGSCEETGWSDEAQTGALGLPDDSFDYDKFVENEFGNDKPVPRGIKPIWWVTAVLLLFAWLAWFFHR